MPLTNPQWLTPTNMRSSCWTGLVSAALRLHSCLSSSFCSFLDHQRNQEPVGCQKRQPQEPGSQKLWGSLFSRGGGPLESTGVKLSQTPRSKGEREGLKVETFQSDSRKYNSTMDRSTHPRAQFKFPVFLLAWGEPWESPHPPDLPQLFTLTS